uniref:Putative secreted peptide n=1 Tax=Anopheles braziliensis TaxID=58242 RepID=A0A2M3ZS47_9DIPT
MWTLFTVIFSPFLFPIDGSKARCAKVPQGGSAKQKCTHHHHHDTTIKIITSRAVLTHTETLDVRIIKETRAHPILSNLHTRVLIN